MELPSTFSFRNWTIKYGLFTPKRTTQSGSKVVVFVHGTPWSSVVFKPLAEAILARKEYSVLLYDLPGYGESQHLQPGSDSNRESRFAGDTSVKFQGLAFEALLKHLQLDGRNDNARPSVVAHDIAGSIVLRTQLIHGCEFDKLLLLDTNTVLPWGDGFYKLARSDPDTFLRLPPNIFDAVVRAVIRSACSNPLNLNSGWEDALARPWIRLGEDSDDKAEAKQNGFVRQIAQANDDDVAEMLDSDMYEKVRCDVTILWGEKDEWIPREKMEQLASMLKHRLNEFVVVPEAGHLLMIDQPVRVASEVFTWLSKP